MKRKTLITVVSGIINVVLLAALAYSTKINSQTDRSLPPSFRFIQRLPMVALAQEAGGVK